MNYIKSWGFNIDTACVEVQLTDGSMVSIDCIAVENEYANNMYETSELDFLIYNEPLSYAELLFSGKIEDYLKNSTNYTPLSICDNKNRGCLTFVRQPLLQMMVIYEKLFNLYHSVAYTYVGLNILRGIGIRLNFLSESCHKHSQRCNIVFPAAAPYILCYICVGKNFSDILGHKAQ